jgi:glucokinase
MMGRRKVAIGVDIGGTKISAGIVGGEGLVYASPRTIATNPKEPGEVIIANLFSLLKNILADAADYDIQGIGIGCTGPLDIGKGILLDVENLPTLNYFPLKDTVEQAFPLRVILDNDANALIYAEALWGAGRNAGSVLGFTLGTGIGCAWINGGKVWRGHSGCAGEVWTSPYKEGILEDYVSGNAVTRLYKEYTKEELPA